MATIFSPSSPSANDDHIPTATLAVPSMAISASTSRRLPPPCWSADETVALIDAYKDKWYSLRRGNLRAFHWQEVANDVAYRCPSSPAKTSVQCRHKMEKLRKRYRAEIQRAAAFGGSSRFSSSWVHFQRMHSMEKGTNSTPPSSDDGLPEEDHKNSIKRVNEVYNNNGYGNQKASFGNQGPRTRSNGITTGCRIRIPGQGNLGPSAPKFSSKFDEMGSLFPDNSSRNFNSSAGGYGSSTQVLQDGFMGSLEKRGDENGNRRKVDNGVGQVAAAIRALGEGFVRMEKVKMDMASRIEEMRMEMELKRTEMILGSQQRIVEAFAGAISERNTKKAKKMIMPEL